MEIKTIGELAKYDVQKLMDRFGRKTGLWMWHFGVDTIDEYTDKEFEVTFEEGMSDLYRIYTKRTKNSKNKIVRVEHQEYPNQEVAEVFVKKMFPGGRLIGA